MQLTDADSERGQIVLDGIDQARRVEVGPDYLSQTALGGEAPALQHAYAVTTYCAQGATVDRAYVMVDPSMDKQESYVATSRTREQTYLYMTPEIEVERNEFAPAAAERDPIAHVGEAFERDRAQSAAHDEALRAELAKLPAEQIAARRGELGSPARQEAHDQETYERQRQAVASLRRQAEKASAEREAVEALGRRERREKLGYASSRESMFEEKLAKESERLSQMQPPRARDRRSASRRPLSASARRRPDRPAPLHRQGAGAQAHRPGQGQGLGSRRQGHRGLSARTRSEGHRQRLRPRATGHSRAGGPRGGEAAACRDSAQARS